MTNTTIFDIVASFLVLVILTEFDKFFVDTIKETTVLAQALFDKKYLLKEVSSHEESRKYERDLDDLLKIETTTSVFANMKIEEHLLQK